MATTKDSMNQDQDEFAQAFAENQTGPVEASEDEQFGISPEAVVEQQPEPAPANAGEMSDATQPMDGAEGQQPNSVALIVADGDDVEKAVGDAAAKETAQAAAEPAMDVDKETQRLKSWEGRLKAMEAKLKASGADTKEEQTEVVADAIEEAADSADTPADAQMVEQISEQVENGAMTAEAAMKQLAEDFGDDFVKMIEAIATAKAREAGSSAAAEKMGEIGKTVDEIINDIVDTKARTHFERIADAHPDFNDIANSEQFAAYIESLPEAEQAAARQTAQQGSAKEIIKLLDVYKKAMPQEQAAAGPMAESDQTEAMDAAEGVRSSGMKLPAQPGASAEDDYQAAWNSA